MEIHIYDGWNRIAEYTLTTDNTGSTPVTIYTLAKTYLWGLDLSGSLQGAGGVGGLLAERILTGTADAVGFYYPTYDGNGNVSEYLTALGVVAAHFEYDPFGNTVVNTDSETSPLFSYRFSTKPLDFSAGLYYYGKRVYDPLTGRWPSRDPIGENGGENLYGFVGNDGVNWVDLLGDATITIGIERILRSEFQIYGRGSITSDDQDVNKCCNLPFSFKTIELVPDTVLKNRNGKARGPTKGVKKPDYYRVDDSVPTYGDDGKTIISLNGATRPATVMGGYVTPKPPNMDQADYDNALLHEFNLNDGGDNIHSGSNATSSAGCIIIGSKYVWTTYDLGRYRPPGVTDSDGTVFVPGFTSEDSQSVYIRFLAAIACVERATGQKATFSVSIGAVPSRVVTSIASPAELEQWVTQLNQ